MSELTAEPSRECRGGCSQGGVTLVALCFPLGMLWAIIHWMVPDRWHSAAKPPERVTREAAGSGL